MFHKKKYLIPQSPLLKNGQVDLDALKTPVVLRLAKPSAAQLEERKELMTVHEVDEATPEATPCSMARADGTKYRSANGLVISGQKRKGERVSCERLRETVEK